MIGLDTNLVVRLVTADDPKQTEAVRRLLKANCTPDHPGFINRIVLCELVWVLKRRFGYSRAAIADAVLALYRAPALRLEDAALLPDALRLYTNSRADLADILIGLGNRRAGCSATFTFDRRAAQVEGFQALQPAG